ncbi:MAG: hypothetical protein H6R13_1966 [Proteobacteria bacterium]|nr:hypothetical protein [Pseudomonadota bacterium]
MKTITVRRFVISCGFLLALLGYQPVAHALESDSESSLSFNGFGTLGATRSSSREAGFVRELSQPHGSAGEWRSEVDSLFGLQANWQVSNHLALISQVISRYHLGSSYSPEVMWAFARWEPTGNTSIRVGRLGTDFYMFSDSRQVGYSYLTVRPSTDFFGVLPFSHIDGADAQLSIPVAGGILRGKAHLGWMDETLPLAERRWDLSGSRMLGGSLTYQRGAWTVRASSSELRFKHNLPIDELTDGLRQAAVMFPQASAAADALNVAGSRSRFHSLGGVYDDGPVQVQLMISRVQHTTTAFQDWWAGYLLAGYRIGEFTPFVGYSWIRSDKKKLTTGIPDGMAPALDTLNSATRTVLSDSRSDQHTTSIGVRWDFASNLDLKVQFDAIRGTSESLFPFRNERAGWNGKTNVLTFVMDFIF